MRIFLRAETFCNKKRIEIKKKKNIPKVFFASILSKRIGTPTKYIFCTLKCFQLDTSQTLFRRVGIEGRGRQFPKVHVRSIMYYLTKILKI